MTDDQAARKTERILLTAIRDAGMRSTLARRAICRVLAQSDETFLSASTILERVAESVREIDFSTVYRTLNQLADLGYLHYLQVGNQSGAWHLTLSRDHQHLICEVCGRTTAVPLAEIAPTMVHLRDKYQFEVGVHHFAILGYCESCKPNSTGPRSTRDSAAV